MVFIVQFFLLPASARADDPPPKPWFTDYRAACLEAEKSHRPLLVVFR